MSDRAVAERGADVLEPQADAVEARVLAAVRDSVIAVGLRRTTATDIARRAGVSRMTLYRRWPDVRTLVTAALTREFEQTLIRVAETAHGDSGRARLVDASERAVLALADDPLVRALRERDPEVLLPYLVERSGRSQLAVRRVIATLLAAGAADGSIRPLDSGDQAAATWLLQLTAQSLVVSAAVVDRETDLRAVVGQLRLLVDSYLRSSPAPPSPGQEARDDQ